MPRRRLKHAVEGPTNVPKSLYVGFEFSNKNYGLGEWKVTKAGWKVPVGNTDIVLFDGLMIGRGEERGA